MKKPLLALLAAVVVSLGTVSPARADPSRSYVDEAIFFTSDPALVHSFMQRYDDLWTDIISYANDANVTTLARHYPAYPIAPEMNFPPTASYRNRALAGYAAERS